MTAVRQGHPDEQHDVLFLGTYDLRYGLYQRPHEMVPNGLRERWWVDLREAFYLASVRAGYPRPHLSVGGPVSAHLDGYYDGFSAWSWQSPSAICACIIRGYVPKDVAFTRFAEVFPGAYNPMPGPLPSRDNP